jgi:hypothetical protein
MTTKFHIIRHRHGVLTGVEITVSREIRAVEAQADVAITSVQNRPTPFDALNFMRNHTEMNRSGPAIMTDDRFEVRWREDGVDFAQLFITEADTYGFSLKPVD